MSPERLGDARPIPKVKNPADRHWGARHLRARWVMEYLTRHGIPGIHSTRGRIKGLRGFEMFAMPTYVGLDSGNGTDKQEHRIRVMHEMNAVYQNTGRRPIGFRGYGGQSADRMLVVMRLPDWTELMKELIEKDPQRWLGEE